MCETVDNVAHHAPGDCCLAHIVGLIRLTGTALMPLVKVNFWTDKDTKRTVEPLIMFLDALQAWSTTSKTKIVVQSFVSA